MISILLGPESMLPHRTQIFIWLLILWQLLLPLGAPSLHPCVDGSCCATAFEQHSTTTCYCHHHSNDSRRGTSEACSSRQDHGGQLPSRPTSHDCSNCAVCQAISAPRVLAALTELPKIAEQTGVAVTPECADPLLGFCLPLQCRAPPAA